METAQMLACVIMDHPSSEEETRSRARELFEALLPAFNPDQITAAKAKSQDKALASIVAEALRTA